MTKWLYLVVYLHADDSVEYFSTNSSELALDKASGWLEDLEEGRETIDVLRLLKAAPFTIERYDAIHDMWVA